VNYAQEPAIQGVEGIAEPAVAIRERVGKENCYDLFFAHHRFGTINLNQQE
jgi:hypothetical protein